MSPAGRPRWSVHLGGVRLGLPVLALLIFATTARAGRLTRILLEERSALAEFERRASSVIAHRRELDKLAYRGRRLAYQVEEAERRLAALTKRAARRRAHLQRRLRALYKLSRGTLVRMLLEAERGQQARRNARALTQLVARDVSELRLYRREVANLRRERAALAGRRAELARLRGRARGRRAALERARASQAELLDKLGRDRRLRTRLAGALSQRDRRLLREVKNLAWRLRHRRGDFAGLRGRLPRPTKGPIVARFGEGVDPRTGLQLSRSGITFRAWSRGRVHAVASGTVRIARRLPGFGLVVLIEHGDGYYTLSGFLAEARVAAGARVERGAEIGRAGVDPLSGRPALYFEVRQGQRALDPAAWIKGAAALRQKKG